MNTGDETQQSRSTCALKARLLIRPAVEDDPRLLSSRTKGFILLVLCLCAASPGFSSTIYFPGIPAITSELNAPSIATTLTAALFILFMGIAPVFWASVSDYYCVRRALFVVSMMIFAVASLGNALMNNIWGLVVLRCVQAVGASCGQSVGAGVIADCYPVEKRGAAFGKFFFGVFFGPLVGPILGGGLITSALSWRATFWFCFAFALMVIILIILTYPETYRDDSRFDGPFGGGVATTDNISERSTLQEVGGGQHPAIHDTVSIEIQPVKVLEQPLPLQQPIPSTNEPEKQPKIAAGPSKKAINPIRPFLMLRHPHVLMASLVSGVAFGCMFAVETVIPDLFDTRYHFNAWQTGLSYLGAGVGNMCGAFISSNLSDRLLLRARQRRNGRHRIEDRLTVNLWPAGFICVPFGLLLFGWGIENRMTYWTGIIGFGIQNFGMNQIMTSTSAYLVDAAPGEGASATAAGNLVRMVFACVLTLAANPMVVSIGPGYTCVFLAALGLASMVLLVALKVYGSQIRRATGFEQPGERKPES